MVTTVTELDIRNGLRSLELDGSSSVIVHSSLRSFGYVEGGASSVCRALVSVCGTIMVPADSWDMTGLRAAPPGLLRPFNAYRNASSWDEFETSLAGAKPFSDDLPIDRELGVVPETLRREIPHKRSSHPLKSFIAAGEQSEELVGAQRWGWPLGPIERLAELGGDVLLLGVSHTSNTAIHVAEQHLGRSRFWRYAKADEDVWIELPNAPGDSEGFDEIEPHLRPVTREVCIGECRARRVAVADVIETATRLILEDPAALLGSNPDPESRAAAALQQRLAYLSAQEHSK